MSDQEQRGGAALQQGSVAEVFLAFLKLGMTSFGGPIAHIGYFREELVVRRKWLSDSSYVDLVALCQFLPGPTSSQVGFALGLTRAGWLGALAAFIGFTLPSALLLFGFALSAANLSGPLGSGAIHGLKIVAVAIVAQAVWGMARSLCPDRLRASIAVIAVGLLALLPVSIGMVVAIIVGAVLAMMLGRSETAAPAGHLSLPVSKGQGILSLLLFALLLAGLPLLANVSQGFDLASGFYQSGSLVFGGGHVILPMLEAKVVDAGWVSLDQFLAGYGATQAIPGPLFTFAAYLGAVLGPEPNGALGAFIALMALFLPGALILIGALPFWDQFRLLPRAQLAMQGANAAVVGILGAALYAPVFTSAVLDMRDFALALACYVALVSWKLPPWFVVILGAGGGMLLAFTG